MKHTRILAIFLFVAAAIAVHWIAAAMGVVYCLSQMTMSIYYAIVVLGLCLVMGYAGQVSMGHGAFFAIGGYTSAVMTTHDFTPFTKTAFGGLLKSLHLLVERPDLYGGSIFTVTPWAAFFTAILFASIAAVLIGYPALRLKGHYLAMATLGFGMIVHKMLVGSALTGAADGISGVPAWTVFPGLSICGKNPARIQNYYAACGLALILLILISNIARSRSGRALLAIHDRETAANAIGINTAAYKLRAFVLSAILAAMAGVFFTHYAGGIGPSEASALKSVRYLALAAVGGMSNLWGGVIISTAINFFSLRGWFGTYDNAVFGLLLIIIMSIAPEGPIRHFTQWIRRRWLTRTPVKD